MTTHEPAPKPGDPVRVSFETTYPDGFPRIFNVPPDATIRLVRCKETGSTYPSDPDGPDLFCSKPIGHDGPHEDAMFGEWPT